MPKMDRGSIELTELYKQLKAPENLSSPSQSDTYIMEIGRLIVSFQELDFHIEQLIHTSIWTNSNFTNLLVWNLDFSKKQMVLLDLHEKLKSNIYKDLEILNKEITACRVLRNNFVHSHWFFSQETTDAKTDWRNTMLQINSQKKVKVPNMI